MVPARLSSSFARWPVTRREFVATTSSAIAGAVLTTRHLHAQVLPTAVGTSTRSASVFLPEPIDPRDLHSLAAHAVDAAMRAGATYADIRLGERHALMLEGNGVEPSVTMNSTLTYGVRALAMGAWAFVHGNMPSIDAVTTVAQQAVAMAKGYATLVTQPAELIPAPVVTGTWTTPIVTDPFTVPIRDYGALIGAYRQVNNRVLHSRLDTCDFMWTRETRVFASAEGSALTQTLYGVEPRIVGTCYFGPAEHAASLRFPCIARAGGYETVGDPTQYETALQTMLEHMVSYARLPVRVLDVGRYPIVADGVTVGAMFGRSLGAALELDRALGEEADEGGISFVHPPLDFLGTEIANPAMTVTATRAMPSHAAVKWDDEGVEPHDYPVIQAGRLVDYHTSRTTAATLRPWYEQQGRPLQSRGCVVATKAGDMMFIRAPHVQVAPGATSADLDALCRTMGRGLLVIGADGGCINTDQQFASLNLSVPTWGFTTGVILQIEKGHIVARLQGHGLEMLTKKLWKQQLVALGDATTLQDTDFSLDKGMPWRPMTQSVSAPAALFTNVNLTVYRRPA